MASLNWTMLDAKRGLVPLPNENIISTMDSGVNVVLDIPDAPPSASASAGGSGGKQKLKQDGKIWLTDQRVSLLLISLIECITLIDPSS